MCAFTRSLHGISQIQIPHKLALLDLKNHAKNLAGSLLAKWIGLFTVLTYDYCMFESVHLRIVLNSNCNDAVKSYRIYIHNVGLAV